MNWKRFVASHKEQLVTVAVLLVTCLVSFGALDPTIISSDDWSSFVAKYAFGELQPLNLADRRPLTYTFYYGLSLLFGVHFAYIYFVNLLILFTSALLLYAILKRVHPGSGWLAALVALTTLVYPVDYTRTWVIMMYIRFCWLLSLGAIWLLLGYMETGHPWSYLLAMLGIVVPLGAYEGQLGVTLLAGILIALLPARVPARRRWVLLGSLLAICISFLAWRITLQPRFFDVQDAYVDAFQLNPALLVERYREGLQAFLSGWLPPLLAQLKLEGINPWPWLSVYAAIALLAVAWVRRSRASGPPPSSHQKASWLRTYALALLVGAAFWGAGYVPIIGLYGPSLAGNASRVNAFAVTGASLALVAVVAMVAGMVARSTRETPVLSTLMLLPFLLAGIFVQTRVNAERAAAWDTQKAIWNGVLETIPDLRDGGAVVIIIPGYTQMRPYQYLPFLSGWEVEAGAQVLYDNPQVGGYYYYRLQEPDLLFSQNGFRQIPTDRTVPYRRLVFVEYDPGGGSVRLVTDLETAIPLLFQAKNYHPLEHIGSKPPAAPLRWLVGK